ncbi:MAG: hypothetical protein Q6J68_05635 [Thermostichales cyanobacterium SZTDM-1c_bins_54]
MRSTLALALVALGIWGSPVAGQPAATFQPGFWQPRVRIDPRQPVQVRIENRLAERVDYEDVENQSLTRPILPGQSLRLQVMAPAFLNIVTPPPRLEISTLFDLRVEPNNTLVIQVRESPDYFGGERVVQVDAQGGVYVF